MPTNPLNDPAPMSDEELRAVFSGLAGQPVRKLDRVRHGRNSSVFKIGCSSGEFVGKVYPPKSPYTRDRLAAEFGAFTFLWKHGVTCIPEPLAADSDSQIGLYEFIPGDRPSSTSISEADIDSATEFLGTLGTLIASADAAYLLPAAEACFSIKSIVENINSRLAPLEGIDSAGQYLDNFREYLSTSFRPALSEISEWSHSACEHSDLGFDTKISREEQTLSPSDFGFHNSIRRTGGQIAFLDFEYFGWDDPAKTISDFLLHPAMDLAKPLKKQFMTGAVHQLGSVSRLSKRVEITYPLFGLKWSLILLNEFLPEHLARRAFAKGASLDRDEVLGIQLKKAKTMTDQIISQYKRFPFHG